MRPFRKYFIVIISFLPIVFSSEKISAQTEEQLRAEWIFNISHGVSWEDESNISEYTIGVFSSEEATKAIEKLAKSKTIKNKPVKIVKYANYEDVKPDHIVYVTKNENAYLGFIYQKLKGKNVLIISDRSKQPEYSVINFLNLNQSSSKRFEINKESADIQNLKFSTQLLKLGGNREVLQRIYAETNKKLIEMQKNLKQKDLEIKERDEQLKKQEIKLEELENKLKEQEKLIKKQEELLKNK